MYNFSTLCGAKTLAAPWTLCTVTVYCGVCRTSGYGDPTRVWVDSNRAKPVSTFALCIWMPAIPHLRCSPSRSSFFSRRKKVIRSFSVFVCTGWRVWKSITTSMKSCIAELAVEIPDFQRYVVQSISSIDWLMYRFDWLIVHPFILWLGDLLFGRLIDCLLACFHYFTVILQVLRQFAAAIAQFDGLSGASLLKSLHGLNYAESVNDAPGNDVSLVQQYASRATVWKLYGFEDLAAVYAQAAVQIVSGSLHTDGFPISTDAVALSTGLFPAQVLWSCIINSINQSIHAQIQKKSMFSTNQSINRLINGWVEWVLNFSDRNYYQFSIFYLGILTVVWHFQVLC